MTCLFCDIAEGRKDALKIYEDASAVAFLDIAPCAPGHYVVIPKHHAATIREVPAGELGAIFGAVQKTVAMLEDALRPDGFTIGINQGRAAGQAIDHLHIHLIPRFKDDGGGSLHTVVHNAPQESLDAMVAKIRNRA